ncbi:MAG: hypothetical protein PQ964_01425 [Methanobacteriaceae archaeon]
MKIRLIIEKKIPNLSIQYLDDEEILASSNYTIFRSIDNGNTFEKLISLQVPFYLQFFGKSNLVSRSLRWGIRNIIKLANGIILAVANKHIFRIEKDQANIVHSFDRGFGPLRKGLCEDNKGNCYFGEYILNNKRNLPVRLFKSENNGINWKVIKTFSDIRHIHCVQFDPFSENIWLCTGDRDSESKIMISKDEGENWFSIASGDQIFRTVSLIFTKESVYWGTDIPTRQNYICRYIRKDGTIEKLQPVSGPVHYSTILGDGVKLFATIVEGNSEGGISEWDKYAHIWASEDGINWQDIISWKKDSWPYIMGYGSIYFPSGTNESNYVYLTPKALDSVDNTLIKAKIELD